MTINRNCIRVLQQLERFKITFTANGRNDHVTMFILNLSLAVFSFSVKLSSLALASKVRIVLHYSHLCTHFFFQENKNANLTFAANAILNLFTEKLIECKTKNNCILIF